MPCIAFINSTRNFRAEVLRLATGAYAVRIVDSFTHEAGPESNFLHMDAAMNFAKFCAEA